MGATVTVPTSSTVTINGAPLTGWRKIVVVIVASPFAVVVAVLALPAAVIAALGFAVIVLVAWVLSATDRAR